MSRLLKQVTSNKLSPIRSGYEALSGKAAAESPMSMSQDAERIDLGLTADQLPGSARTAAVPASDVSPSVDIDGVSDDQPDSARVISVSTRQTPRARPRRLRARRVRTEE